MTFKTIDLNLVLEQAKAETIAMAESKIDQARSFNYHSSRSIS